MKKIDLLEMVSDELGLNFIEQDWGIINESPDRLEEFIEYFNIHQPFPEAIKYQLFELIIASCNEALLKNSISTKGKVLFKKFIQQHSRNPTFFPIISYWKKIMDIEGFPVGRLL